MNYRLLMAACAGTVLMACVAAPPLPEAVPSAAVDHVERLAQSAADQQRANTVRQQAAQVAQLRELLAAAQSALAADRLKTPANDNAYDLYQQVLAVDGQNPEAHWGMGQITARYLELAQQFFASAQLEQAELMLQRAESVAASPEQTEAIRLRHQPPAAANELRLATAALSAHSAPLVAQLGALAKIAQAQNSRLLIVARSDAEGRWIYRQMRNAVNGYRLRGNIERGLVPRVLLIEM